MNARKTVSLLVLISLVMALVPITANASPSHVSYNERVHYSSCITHVVQPGENLFRISLRYNVTIAAIMQANGLYNANYVYVGQVLCIPTGQAAPPPQPAPAPAGNRYQVQPGDTLLAIAVRFGTTVYALCQANGLTNANYIYVGQWLTIPGSTPPAPAPQPTTAGKWKGEYYKNPHLAGSPTLVRYDTHLNFDWGSGSPSSAIPVDNFSARWTRTVYFKAGSYRFTLTVDDGARLWVDDRLLVDKWGQAASATHTADVELAAGYHSVRMEHQEFTGVAVAMLGWIQLASGGAASGPQPSGAWTGEYFSNIDLGGSPDMRRLDPAIDFGWGTGSPLSGVKDFFSIRWTRNVQFEAGTYRFSAWVDDGVRIYVDGVLVLNQWHDADGVVCFDDAVVSAGVHEVKVEYYEHAYEAMISVWWEKIK
ncbi:MAG: LysM peptidoglycan-binding domain-containing protein [Thermoflexales bacterium]|nr:LysM peptidoglycan-binding domain-containing protein [Thermoflexales bacterium]